MCAGWRPQNPAAFLVRVEIHQWRQVQPEEEYGGTAEPAVVSSRGLSSAVRKPNNRSWHRMPIYILVLVYHIPTHRS